MESAEIYWSRMNEYLEVIKALQKNKGILGKSSIFMLNPFVHDHGLPSHRRKSVKVVWNFKKNIR